jgi:CubicO group peptidase (beta-lactamase class C family)
VCLVVRPGQRVVESLGIADRASGLDWTVSTQSQLASISKQFVAACTLILAARGVLDLDESIRRHLPAAGPSWDEVSIRHLVTHTSGMSHWSEQPGFDPSRPTPADERLSRFLATSRPARAGETFRYSSPGYVVLSAVLVAASGQPYNRLARELVILPLGLAHTNFNSPGPGEVAAGYRAGQPVQPWDLGSMPGAGDVWSTAGDVAQFLSSLHNGGLLPPAAQTWLHGVAVPTRASPSDSPIQGIGYAAGHFIGTLNGQLAYIHPGDNPGYQSPALWLPDCSTAIVVLSNEETADLEPIATQQLATRAPYDDRDFL